MNSVSGAHEPPKEERSVLLVYIRWRVFTIYKQLLAITKPDFLRHYCRATKELVIVLMLGFLLDLGNRVMNSLLH